MGNPLRSIQATLCTTAAMLMHASIPPHDSFFAMRCHLGSGVWVPVPEATCGVCCLVWRVVQANVDPSQPKETWNLEGLAGKVKQ